MCRVGSELNVVLLLIFRSTESIESNAATDESPPGGEEEVHSLPHTASYTRRERMMPPEEKLGYFESRAQAMADSQQVYID